MNIISYFTPLDKGVFYGNKAHRTRRMCDICLHIRLASLLYLDMPWHNKRKSIIAAEQLQKMKENIDEVEIKRQSADYTDFNQSLLPH